MSQWSKLARKTGHKLPCPCLSTKYGGEYLVYVTVGVDVDMLVTVVTAARKTVNMSLNLTSTLNVNGPSTW